MPRRCRADRWRIVRGFGHDDASAQRGLSLYVMAGEWMTLTADFGRAYHADIRRCRHDTSSALPNAERVRVGVNTPNRRHFS